MRCAREAVSKIVPPGDPISILKIDTEGFEFVILEKLRDWLPQTDVIFLEIHSEQRRHDIDRLLFPWFVLRHCDIPFGHRIKALYLSRRALAENRLSTENAPEILV